MSNIADIRAFEVLDSRGNPTVQADDGSIQNWRVSNCPIYTLLMREKYFREMAHCLPLLIL